MSRYYTLFFNCGHAVALYRDGAYQYSAMLFPPQPNGGYIINSIKQFGQATVSMPKGALMYGSAPDLLNGDVHSINGFITGTKPLSKDPKHTIVLLYDKAELVHAPADAVINTATGSNPPYKGIMLKSKPIWTGAKTLAAANELLINNAGIWREQEAMRNCKDMEARIYYYDAAGASLSHMSRTQYGSVPTHSIWH